MQTRNRNTFSTIHTEGALLPADLLERIRSNDSKLEGLDAQSYHLAPGEKINEAINRSWNRLNGLWGAFQAAREKLGSTDPGTTLTRERWLLPLFQELGFGRLSTSKAVDIEGKSYPISHRWQNVPLHLVGCGIELDKRTPGAAGASRTSPHSLMQEYLNRSDDVQWGVISNGLGLRILRDNATLTRQAYIEFDLESMFDGEIYSDFVLLWLMCHQSRFETTEKQTECLLEKWSKSAQESGTRALDDLRRGVEEAIVSFGQGFLQHPLNGELRNRLKNGDLSAQDYYRQLLRLVYRLIFLFAAEDRDLLLLPGAAVETRQRFLNYYSTTHLRALAQRQRGSRHHDRYEALRLVMTLLGSDSGCPELAIPALGGFLFDARSTADLNEARLDNQALLSAVRSLAFINEGNTRRAVDYRNLGPEELGSVYESLLELHPLLNTDAGTFQLTSAAGNERKTTGSYYTPTSLIQVLLDSALDPAIEDRLKGKQDAAQQEQALLELKVCDPACGSGHFLIAAAHRIAGRLAEVRAGDSEPSPNETRRALRDVIRHCIYGVDINPMAVELCKVNLWLESLEPGKPLSFLDAHIKCGNSLIGVNPKVDLNELEIPDEAFNPVISDHKPTAALLKKRNKQEREGQESLFITVIKPQEKMDNWLADRTRILEAMPEESAAEVHAKAEAFRQVNESVEYRRQRQIADLWTTAFFWNIEESGGKSLEILAPTHGQLRRLRTGNQTQSGLLQHVEKIRQEEGFFHWSIEFADVRSRGGFDCIIGNPPWEQVQPQEVEFFSSQGATNIAELKGKKRKDAIEKLRMTNPSIINNWESYVFSIEKAGSFIRNSNSYPYTAIGKLNTYSLFAEKSWSIISKIGYVGIVLPTGIVTDEGNSKFFDLLASNGHLLSVFDFENKESLFPGIAVVTKFCLFSFQGQPDPNHEVQLAFFLSNPNQLNDQRRKFTLSTNDFKRMNPNTRTCPVLRTSTDAKLLRKIYNRIPSFVVEETDENPWHVEFRQGLFNMTSDSGEFLLKTDLEKKGYELRGNYFIKGDSIYLPLYEAKLMHQYNHRHGTFDGISRESLLQTKAPTISPSESELANCDYHILPRYWVTKSSVKYSTPNSWKRNWFIGFRNVIQLMTNARSAMFCILPLVGVGNSAPILLPNVSDTDLILALLGNLNSLIFDFVTRQKMGGANLNFFIVKQLAVVPPNGYSKECISLITPKVLELSFTTWDLQPFANDVWRDASPELKTSFIHQWEENTVTTSGGHRNAELPDWVESLSDGFPYPPFKWDEDRRAVLRAELDAYYAKLYGLSRDELRYILDPQDVYGPEYPGETFRVLKDKEIRQYGEYRTRRLVLEAWDRLEGVEVSNPNGYSAQSVAVPPKQETISMVQPRSESRPAAVQTQLPASAKPNLPVPPPAKVEKEIDPPVDQPTLSDFGLYKCEVCGKMVMGFEKANHEQEKHGGKSVQWKKMR